MRRTVDQTTTKAVPMPALESHASRESPSVRWQAVAVVAAMAGLGILAWKLHEAQDDAARLQRNLTNLSILARAVIEDHAHTKRGLANANHDKRVLHRFLDAAREAEVDLEDDLGDLLVKHRTAVLTSEQRAQAWSAQGTALKQSLDGEMAQREAAQQLAANFESESQRLAGVAGELERLVMRFKGENQGMLNEIGRQGAHISALERDNSSLRCDNASLERDNSSLRSSIGQLQNEISGLRSTICSLESRIRCLQNELCNLRGHSHK